MSKVYCFYHADESREVAENEYCAACLLEELKRQGFRKCDIAACNCGGWHRTAPTKAESELYTWKARAEKAERELQDARNLWNFAPEDSHEHWIQVMNEALHNKAERDTIKARCEKIVSVWNSQSGRVFESMGTDNPRAIAIDEAITSLELLLKTCGLDELRKQGEEKP